MSIEQRVFVGNDLDEVRSRVIEPGKSTGKQLFKVFDVALPGYIPEADYYIDIEIECDIEDRGGLIKILNPHINTPPIPFSHEDAQIPKIRIRENGTEGKVIWIHKPDTKQIEGVPERKTEDQYI